jgi:regulatory protein
MEPATPAARVVRSGRMLSLKGRALQLLARREHSRAELQRKLAAHEQSEGQLQSVLDELQAKGFINEERVIESVVHRRAGKLGAARIRQELQAKGLPPEAMAQALAQLKSTELERAREVWQRKFGQAATEPKEHARQTRFLISRGFAAEVVRKIVG